MSKTPAFNPYAPPAAAFASGPGAANTLDACECWRGDDLMIAPLDAHLPPRCVKCNEPATMDSPRAYLRHHPGWYALIALDSTRLLVPVRITKDHVHLKGCGAAFSDSLPILDQEKQYSEAILVP